MKIKIGDEIFDSSERPLMIILSEKEKQQIANMGEATKYCAAPDDMSEAALVEFMTTEKK